MSKLDRRNRETRAIDEIECPRCHAKPGQVCYIHGVPGKSPHGPACHNERRAANQERRRLAGEAGPVPPIPTEPGNRAARRQRKLSSPSQLSSSQISPPDTKSPQ